MKKTMFMLVMVLITGQLAMAQVANRFTVGLGLSTDLEKYGPSLKLDYHVNPSFGVGIRAHRVRGTWQDYSNALEGPYAPYNLIVDYTDGNQTAISLDAIYHIIGNNQTSKFGMRVEAGIGYHAWSQTSLLKTDAPLSHPAYYRYEKQFGMNALSFKAGLGFEYAAGPGKLFLDIPLHVDIYGTEFDNFSNQTWNNGMNLNNTKETSFRLQDSPDSFIKFNIGYQIPLGKTKATSTAKTGCPTH